MASTGQCGTRHRLDNPGHVPLELIEVQSGSYLGEDDIVRFEDGYSRTPEMASKLQAAALRVRASSSPSPALRERG
nr:hypothetical protein [Algiphilus aromaticivorans]